MKLVNIDRRHHLPYEAFAREYLFPGKPVIISGAVAGWQAFDKWTPDYFKTNFGSMNLSIDAKNHTMADFIDRVKSSTSQNPAPYLRNAVIDQFLPQLLPDIDPLPGYFSTGRQSRDHSAHDPSNSRTSYPPRRKAR